MNASDKRFAGSQKSLLCLALWASASVSTADSLSPQAAPSAEFKRPPQTLAGTAPGWDLKTIDGKSSRLADYAGKVVVLNFWGTWCAPCRAETPTLVKLQKDLGKRGLVVVGAAMDESRAVDAVKSFAKRFSVDYPIVMADSTLQSTYQILGAPTTYIIDRKGQLAAKRIGAVTRETLDHAVLPLLDAKAK